MAAAHRITPGRVPHQAYVRFFEASVDYALFFLDPEGIICSWNRGAEHIKGYAEKEIVGQHFSIFYTASDLAAKKPQYELRIAIAEGRYQEEGWRVRKDGTMFWASVTITAVKEPDGRLMGFAKVTRDLTDRKHAEQVLRQSEERFRLLTQCVVDYAICMLDTEGHVASWNEGARRLSGYHEDEILGEHFRRFYLPADAAQGQPERALEAALRDGRHEQEGWRARKDGSPFWASATIAPLRDDAGRHLGFAKVTRDLTARKSAEEDLRQRALAYATLNRELDAFSHTVAHDLRSPIRAVEHLSSVLLDEEGPRLSDEGKRTLEVLHGSAMNMAKLVQDLLDLSTAGGREPRRTDVDVGGLARAVVSDLLRVAREREIEVRVEEGMRASADPSLLRVALTNLIGNAIKFTRDVKDARVEIGRALLHGETAFFVRDNGVGFDPVRQDELFRPFSRLHAINEFEGTGIGLATVHRVIARHGGRVWATAEPGRGATFYFTLPTVEP